MSTVASTSWPKLMSAPPVGTAPTVVELRDGRRVSIRPIRPDDRKELQDAFVRLSSEARYTRFMSAVKNLPPGALERAVHPVAGREFALVAIAGEGADEDIVGGARYFVESDNVTCEFAITLADDWHRVGLASRLMKELIKAARAQGINRMEGFVLASNEPMLNLARRLGFHVTSSSEGPTVKLVWLELDSN
jgi:RimJ/RimL family protein N-acetyltransferase